MNRARLLILLALGSLAACAPSPLYVGNAPMQPEVPRDGRGEPLLSAVRPAQMPATPPPR